MTRSKIIFTGNFGEYFFKSLGLAVLTVLSFGLLLPYYVYWNFKWFFTKMEVELPAPIVHVAASQREPEP